MCKCELAGEAPDVAIITGYAVRRRARAGAGRLQCSTRRPSSFFSLSRPQDGSIEGRSLRDECREVVLRIVEGGHDGVGGAPGARSRDVHVLQLVPSGERTFVSTGADGKCLVWAIP
jgi:hypothetical protein